MEKVSSDKPLLTGNELLELIPQRPPVVMVDCFWGLDEQSSYTGLKIEEGNLFCRDGCLDECGVTEHIAQSAAVRVGFIYKTAGEKTPVGFIGSVDKMTYYMLPSAGDELFTTVKVEQEVGDITLISARVETGGCLVAEGRMKIFLKKDV